VIATDQQTTPQLSLPIVSCPMCAAKMRLAGAEPNVTDSKLRITFDCKCGFEYRMSERIAQRVVRDHL
jgi:hypothetical protein